MIVFDLDPLLEKAHEASQSATQHRVMANESGRAIIQVLAERLMEALEGDTLRGLPNLLPEHGAVAFYGLRVNSSRAEMGASAPLPKDGREVLVLSRLGKLLVAGRAVQEDGTIVAKCREPLPREIIADDLEPFVRALARALVEHITRTEKRAKSYAATHELAEKLALAIGIDATLR